MVDPKAYSTALVEREGIYFTERESAISYPESGNDLCFQIEENSYWFKHRNNCIAAAVLKHSPNAVFFDIGGGNGFVARELERRGIATVLVEPGIQGCLNARKRGLEQVICSTLENASFRDGSIPAIGSFDVVEHIEDDIAFLSTLHRLLAADGRIYLTVPAYTALWSREDVEAGHYRRYTRKEMEDKLRAVGFTVEYSTYLFSILVAAVFLFRSIPSRLGGNKIKENNLQELQSDHVAKSGILAKLLDLLWSFELKRVNGGRSVPFGSSLFVVARKVGTDQGR